MICSTTSTEERYTSRHDSILCMLAWSLTALENSGFQLYAELESCKISGTLFSSLKPDILLIRINCMYIIELTICFEANATESRQYKIRRYANIENETNRKYDKIVKLYIEVTSTGFIIKDIKDFLNLIKQKY